MRGTPSCKLTSKMRSEPCKGISSPSGFCELESTAAYESARWLRQDILGWYLCGDSKFEALVSSTGIPQGDPLEYPSFCVGHELCDFGSAGSCVRTLISPFFCYADDITIACDRAHLCRVFLFARRFAGPLGSSSGSPENPTVAPTCCPRGRLASATLCSSNRKKGELSCVVNPCSLAKSPITIQLPSPLEMTILCETFS